MYCLGYVKKKELHKHVPLQNSEKFAKLDIKVKVQAIYKAANL